MASVDQKFLQLDFAFSVVSDDGNLPSALVAGSSDLIKQVLDSQNSVGMFWSCMLLLHEGLSSETD